MNNIYQYFRKLYSTRVLIPVSNIRKQGFSAETLALSISIGIIGGAFPVIGFASYICLLLTLVFKQNILIVQVVNWIVYPLQILLIIPLMKLGNSIFTGGELTITMHQVIVAFQSGIMNGIKLIGIISLYGIIAWAVIAIPTLFILYSLFLIIFRYFNRVKLKIRQVVVSKSHDQNLHTPPVSPSLILETLTAKNNG